MNPNDVKHTTVFLKNPADLFEHYDVFILDLWGVVHNGLKPYAGAAEFMTAARERGKTIALLSNAPRRIAQVHRSLVANIGVPESAFNTLMTSGEAAWQHLNRYGNQAGSQNGRVSSAQQEGSNPPGPNLTGPAWFLGEPENDRSMLEGHGFDFTPDPAAAGFVLNTGPSRPRAKVEDWDRHLAVWLENKTPMVCANPDRVVHKGEVLQICGGAIAERFGEKGGTVIWHGKPFAGVYDTVFEQNGVTDRSKTLMVGDSFITDIAGAQAAGIDSCLITGGIYRERIQSEGIEPLIKETGFRPTYATEGLKP